MRSRSGSLAGLVAGALASGGAVPAAGAVAEAPPEERHCTTVALTAEEIAAGETSVFECYDDRSSALAAASAAAAAAASRSGSFYLGIHYDGFGGAGSSFYLTGSDCNGGGISIAPGDWWANRISSTRHYGCSAVKHWSAPGNGGASELTQGGWGAVRNLGGGLDNNTESIQYLGVVN